MSYDEPRYVDDPFAEEDTGWKYYTDLPEAYHPLLLRAFRVTGRTSNTFRKPAEKRKWGLILGQVERGLIPLEWIDHCIDFAKTKNSGISRGVAYTFDTLTKYIQNKAAMTDWQARHPEVLRKPGGYEFPT